MKFLKRAFLLVFTCCLFIGCASQSSRSALSAILDKIDQVDLAQLDPEKAISIFGNPDIRDTVGSTKSEEALVYFNPQNLKSPFLSLIFDSQKRKLISLNFFTEQKDTELNFSKIQKRYSRDVFENPTPIKNGAYGFEMSRYKSSTSPLRVFVKTGSDKVSGLSWVLIDDSKFPKRRPTSH